MAARMQACVTGLALLGSARALVPYDIMQCQAGAAAMKTEMMTTCQYHQIANAVTSTWSALSDRCDEGECQQAAFAGCVMRMVGHDFMDFAEGNGGSDGCMDLEADENKGLAQCLYDGQMGLSLNQAYQPFCQSVSLADFFVIAGEAIIMSTRRLAEGADAEELNFKSTFRFGRETARECPDSRSRLPEPEGSCEEVDRVFLKNMGLEWRDATALMGAHTLGKASMQNSGYEGWWTGSPSAQRLDNKYFQAMLLRGWSTVKAVGNNPTKNQWRRSDGARAQTEHHMMLNTDLCLAYDNTRTPGNRTGETLNAAKTGCCAWSTASEVEGLFEKHNEYCGGPRIPPGFIAQRALCCDNNPNAVDCGNPVGRGGKAFDHVKYFAEDDRAWMQAFEGAWKMATENGVEGTLRELEACDAMGGEEPGLIHFDCSAGEANWERGWSELKKGFCCKSAGVGCEEDFDCEAGKDNWSKGWSIKKKYHCCKETGTSCEELFDCSSGADNWERGWSLLKKEFCCKSAHIGCEPIARGDPVGGHLQRKYGAEVRTEAGQQPARVVLLGSLLAFVGAGAGFVALRARTPSQTRGGRVVEAVGPCE